MKLAVVVGTNEVKRMRSALKFVNAAVTDSEVKLFILGECFKDKILDVEELHLKEAIESFLERGGKIYTCGTCIVVKKFIKDGEEGVCPLSTMEDLYEIIKWADKVIYF
ncbi:uncharacterized protein involved in oxidation of intracellular sulfur [Desulfurobacterium pacificum]|uniref:Uncharacterized protein involved in oxidation of intracellular sulfur n=1 Tax=Desulfurobacterium pacificum TaxID=240166 RepID=A0ABY1N7Y8_9BACT|nr:DsrE family protein [Desulfurobacterium pacificum]SMP02855.1 uncharacterized protein involved in oxidation of intracellular sulfur [Desulfurobacterium pacificum]